MAKTPADVIQMAKDEGVEMVDLRFVDMPGSWQHWTIPVSQLDEGLFTDGAAFDGSSVRGFQKIQESDMTLVADPDTAFIDPFFKVKTLCLIGNVVDPIKEIPYTRDPRYVAHKAEAYLKDSGIADTAFFGPEAEFYIFDDVSYDQRSESAFYRIDSSEGVWNTGWSDPLKPNLGYKVRQKEGYFPVPPSDSLQDIRTEMVQTLIKLGIPVEAHHHEVGTAGQSEVNLRFGTLTQMGDAILTYKYVVKNTAKAWGKTATFMPKPLFGDNGSGMHVH